MHGLVDGDMFRCRQLINPGEFGEGVINLPDAGRLRRCPSCGLVHRVVFHRLTVPVGAAARSPPRALRGLSRVGATLR